ncbi:MAG: DUF2933 domain-containing protein [Candidatus Methylomirabilales bacterium]
MEHRATETHGDRLRSVPGNRAWLMIIGCGLPLAAVLLLPLLGVSWGTALLFLVLLACPLMHLFGMHGGHHQPKVEEESMS